MMRPLPSLDEECFFIAPIGSDGSPERNRSDGVLEFIVGRAATELGLTAVRADQIAEPGQITLQVIDHVLGARAAVADLTGLNPNVFYELAVRHTARLPVALIVEKGSPLPFDIAPMRTIFFDYTDLRSADQCRRDIVAHLRNAMEAGAVDSPIATSIDVRSLAGGSAVERSVAEMVTTVEEVARLQRDNARMIEVLTYELARGGRTATSDVSAAMSAAVVALNAFEHALAERDDEELQLAFRALEDPLRYAAERVLARQPRAASARAVRESELRLSRAAARAVAAARLNAPGDSEDDQIERRQ